MTEHVGVALHEIVGKKPGQHVCVFRYQIETSQPGTHNLGIIIKK